MTPEEQNFLLSRIASINARPFISQVVQTPWSNVVDVELLHKTVKQQINVVIDECHHPDAVRCLTIAAPHGYGKTHLLAWTRHLLDRENSAVFVYVPPFIPESLSFGQHVMKAALDAIWLRSRTQKSEFQKKVQRFLVDCYDRIINSNKKLKKALGLKVSIWQRLFSRRTLRIEKRGPEDQLGALQKAFTCRAFFEKAFEEFERRLGASASQGIAPDRDTFVAACLLACGNENQRWFANRWFRGDTLPHAVLKPFHLDHACQGLEKTRNGLFTLNRLLNKKFCVTFDQMENTYIAIRGNARATNDFTFIIQPLSTVPFFCFIFAFQLATWREFMNSSVSGIPGMLLDRMTEGHGVQPLKPLDNETAFQLVSQRLESTVWKALEDDRPTDIEPFFPFTHDDIDQMLQDSQRELREFLKIANRRFTALLENGHVPSPPKVRLPISLIDIQPGEVISHEPTPVSITGKHLPSDFVVYFDGQPAPSTPTRRENQIDVTTPTGLLDDETESRNVKVLVQDAENSENAASLTLRFTSSEVPRPYRKHINGKRLATRREELKIERGDFQQWWVAEELTKRAQRDGMSLLVKDYHISNVENERWKNAPDELYVQLANLYELPLSYFRKS